MGETQRVLTDPAPAVADDQLKMEYRRPERIPFPPNNPYTPEKAMLGRMRYYDTRLSGAGTIACVTCHNPGFGHGDGPGTPAASGPHPLDRRSPGIGNNTWGVLFMWDGRAPSLEQRALGPIQSKTEMNQPLGAASG